MKNGEKFFTVLNVSLLAVAIFSRLLPHAPNFTALGAVAFFSGYLFRSKPSTFAIPFTALIVSDLFLGFHATLPWVYFAFALTILIGRQTRTVAGMFLGNALAAVLFFLVTNFGVWLGSGMYVRSFGGLALCFTAALPFFTNTMASQFFFGMILFVATKIFHRRGFGARSAAHAVTIAFLCMMISSNAQACKSTPISASAEFLKEVAQTLQDDPTYTAFSIDKITKLKFSTYSASVSDGRVRKKLCFKVSRHGGDCSVDVKKTGGCR